MLSMWKLLTATTLLSSVVFAQSSDDMLIKHLEKNFKNNPSIKELSVHIVDKTTLQKPAGWSGYIVRVDANVVQNGQKKDVSQKMIWFANKEGVLSPELFDMKTGQSLKDLVTPSFKEEFYTKANFLYGNKNAKHKVALFSDPLCPFCRKFIPEAIEEMKKSPEKFAIYYYHLPLEGLHPAAVPLAKAAIVAEHQGKKDVVLNLYKVDVDSRESDVSKILEAFNKTMKTDIKPKDLEQEYVLKQYEADRKIADELMVRGTPSVFFDGKADKTKRKYQKVK